MQFTPHLFISSMYEPLSSVASMHCCVFSMPQLHPAVRGSECLLQQGARAHGSFGKALCCCDNSLSPLDMDKVTVSPLCRVCV